MAKPSAPDNNRPEQSGQLSQTGEATGAEGEAIDRALLEMEILYRSRCVQATRSNVTVREIRENAADENR